MSFLGFNMLTDPESRKGQSEHYIWSPSKTEKESIAQLILTLIRKSKNPSLIAALHHFL
jgi:hypothetical protein